MTHVIDGRAIAAVMNEQTAGSAARLRVRGVIPALAVVMPADDGSVAPGAVVIDVGINPASSGGGLVGDVDARAVTGIASAITPVPGGVGPLTTAQLMSHTIRAAGSERAIT